MKILTLVAAILLVVIPAFLVLYPHYRDNWLQFLGLCGVSTSTVFIIDHIERAVYIPFAMEGMAIALALYFVGTLCKVLKHRPRKGKVNEAPSTTQLPSRD
jgi:hypothetical protein